MPQLNNKGPEGKGSGTGRKLGLCNKYPENKNLGTGMGLRRKAASGKGLGKRNRSGINQSDTI